MATKKKKPIERLMAAMDECAIARGEANWTNGYRAGTKDTAGLLHNKEIVQWQRCDVLERRFRRLALKLLRDERAAALEGE